MGHRIGFLVLAILAAACSAGTAPPSGPTPSIALVESAAPTQAPTVKPTVTPVPTVGVDLHGGQDAATQVAIAEGSLGMTVAQYIGNYNATLDQGQYPITATPTTIADQVYQVTPEDTNYSTILFVTNVDGTLRSVTLLSTAKSVSNPIDRGLAQLESLVVWSTGASAANPTMSEAQSNGLLGSIGVVGGRDFGTYAIVTEYLGLRYFLIETVDGTDLIIHDAD